LRLFDTRVAVEIERSLDPIGRRELDRQIPAREVFQS